MHERLKALRRVLHVHELIEEMHESESQRAAAEVRAAEYAIGTERGIAQLARLEGHKALLDGDRLGWSFASVQQGIARRREVRLAPVLSEREQRSNAARERHVDSRQWSERMKRLVEQAEGSLEEMEDKRTQREADDRYLSRKRWMQSKKDTDETRR
jgi:hypothetical protein